MKFSYNWLQTYFEEPLPIPTLVAEKITFHSSEIEEIVVVGDDTVFDIKVLPDKSAWLLSHRGLAKELSVIYSLSLKDDPFTATPGFLTEKNTVKISLDTPVCDFYGTALITGVSVGPSPAWLVSRLEAIGQRSINNIVDATNYVMFDLGQPLHAFDADTLGLSDTGAPHIRIRSAIAGEHFTTLSNEERELTTDDAVITDGISGRVLALAGVKGGLDSGVTSETKTILLESAHFDRVAIRKSSQRHKLQTDAAKRYENGLSRAVAPHGLVACARLITAIAGGTVTEIATAGESADLRKPVTVSLSKINSVLGVSLTKNDITDILNRFGYFYEVDSEESFAVTPPPERDDLLVAEDVIEEIGRIHGLAHIVSIPPLVQPLAKINARQYYAHLIRTVLAELGFAEVYTSSFRSLDTVHLKNALASDKSYLRSRLQENLLEVRERNIPHRDLLGLNAVQVFEIGTVFGVEHEAFHVGLAVQTNTQYKAKIDDALLITAVTTIETALGKKVSVLHTAPGYIEFSLDELVAVLPVPADYAAFVRPNDVMYKSFSVYPAVSRDIAMWVAQEVEILEVERLLRTAAGENMVRLTHLDTFSKDERTSLAFRLVFQSHQKTLESSEVDAQMSVIYDAVSRAGFEVR